MLDSRAGTSLRVSLVATVLNEYGSLPGWLAALRAQRRLPDECIIVDGGSTDGTFEALQAAELPFRMVLVRMPGVNISAGRNAAIARADGDVVVVTDAGTTADEYWLERLVEPLEADAKIDIASGFFQGEATSLWTGTLAAATLPDATEIDPSRFLPSSRSVAFRRRWFQHGFQYPEWLDYCEDVVLDLQLRRAGAKQKFISHALVHFEPRRGPLGYMHQYYRYARGDGKAGLFARRHAVRYVTYAGALMVLKRRRQAELALAAGLGLLYIRPGVRRFLSRADAGQPVIGRVLVAGSMIGLQRLIGDLAKMAGYPAGLVWRLRVDRSLRFWKSGWTDRDPSGALRRP